MERGLRYRDLILVAERLPASRRILCTVLEVLSAPILSRNIPVGQLVSVHRGGPWVQFVSGPNFFSEVKRKTLGFSEFLSVSGW